MKRKRVTRVFPVFAVRDLDEALRFYREKLGFTVAWTWGEPATRAGVALDDVEIQLESSGFADPSGTSVVYCHMRGVDAYHADCRARGAPVERAPADRPWGMRDFRVVDPSGNRIGFGEPLPGA
jgi:catechol 2,3-dioxygenase-like lactoylglutathione lyase family enzyme